MAEKDIVVKECRSSCVHLAALALSALFGVAVCGWCRGEASFKQCRVLADRQPGAGAKAAEWPVLKTYAGAALRQVKLPLGGIGTGTVSLSGRGGLVDWEVQNRPAKGYTPSTSHWAPIFNPSFVLRTETADGRQSARLLEGPLYPDEYEGDMGCRAPAMFRSQVGIQKGVVGKTKLYPGIGLSCYQPDGRDAVKMAKQILVVRELGLDGFTVFNFDRRAERVLPVLRKGVTKLD